MKGVGHISLILVLNSLKSSVFPADVNVANMPDSRPMFA
jgi:hypothetical protein